MSDKYPVYLSAKHIATLVELAPQLSRMPIEDYTKMLGVTTKEAQTQRRAIVALMNALFETHEDMPL